MWRSTICLAVASLLVALCLSTSQAATAKPCMHTSCSFGEQDVPLETGEFRSSLQSVQALAGARFSVHTTLTICSLPACNMTIMLVTQEQLEQVKALGVPNLTLENAPFLQQGVTLFVNVTKTHNFTVYFQKHFEEYAIAFYLNPGPQNHIATALFQYNASFDYDVCHGYIGGVFGVFMLGVTVFTCALIITSSLRREVAIRAQNAVEELEERRLKNLRKFYRDKHLRAKKEAAWWPNAPYVPFLCHKCQCRGICSQPKYPFFPYHWLFNHDWLSFIWPAPDERLNRWNKLLVILTKVITGMVLLTVWVPPIISVSSVVSSTSLPSAWKELLAEMFTKSFAIWVVEELIGIFYPWILYKAQNKGNQRNEISIGGTAYEVNDPSQGSHKLSSFLHFLLRELGSFVLLVVVFLMFISLYQLRDYLSCRYVEIVVTQIFVLEFYRLIFPGLVVSWLVYIICNTWGVPSSPIDPPSEDAELQSYVTADEYREISLSINGTGEGSELSS